MKPRIGNRPRTSPPSKFGPPSGNRGGMLGNFLPYALIPQPKVAFPSEWAKFFDGVTTPYVKRKYSPQEKWKDKPFTSADIHFFKKGVRELSDIFTVERDRRINTYFQHPKFRSSYLLYFLPLHAAKFYILFNLHKSAILAHFDALIAKHAKEGSFPLTVRDFGSGPGTATIAFLLFLSQLPRSYLNKMRLEVELWDQNAEILKDGQALIRELVANLKFDEDKVQLRTLTRNWVDFAKRPQPTDLILFGNVLNEGFVKEIERLWIPILNEVSPLGLLFVEPSTRKNSQLLSRLREDLLALENSPVIVRGPCLHQQSCPLLEGRDWCHFSIPAEIPGRWFKEISGTLGSERMWAKMSYLWIYRDEKVARIEKKPAVESDQFKVVSDAFNHKETLHVLLCTPKEPRKVRIDFKKKPHRGDLIIFKKRPK